MSAHADWVARGVAIGGVVLGVANFLVAQREGLWKRRYAQTSPIRDAFEDLASPIERANDPDAVQAVFTTTSGARLEELRDAIDSIPYWKLRRNLNAFVDDVAAIRGAQNPDTPHLSNLQLGKARAASKLVTKIRKRLVKAARKGSA